MGDGRRDGVREGGEREGERGGMGREGEVWREGERDRGRETG